MSQASTRYNLFVITLRPAVAGDISVIRSMILREGLDPSTVDWRHFIVATDGAKIVGMAQVKAYADCREFGSLAVSAAYRKRGIGAQLVRMLMEREAGAVYLLCRESRVPYYSKFGFEVIEPEAAPKTLRTKLRFARLFSAFGVRVVAMLRPAR